MKLWKWNGAFPFSVSLHLPQFLSTPVSVRLRPSPSSSLRQLLLSVTVRLLPLLCGTKVRIISLFFHFSDFFWSIFSYLDCVRFFWFFSSIYLIFNSIYLIFRTLPGIHMFFIFMFFDFFFMFNLSVTVFFFFVIHMFFDFFLVLIFMFFILIWFLLFSCSIQSSTIVSFPVQKTIKMLHYFVYVCIEIWVFMFLFGLSKMVFGLRSGIFLYEACTVCLYSILQYVILQCFCHIFNSIVILCISSISFYKLV